MIKFDVRQNQRIRKVMKKLRPFVKKRRVVFVAFNDERARGPQLKAGRKILRHPADQKRRLPFGIPLRRNLVNPGQHAGRCRLSMRTGNHQRFAPGEKFFVNQRRHGGEPNALVKHALHFRITARQGIANHHQVRCRRKICFRK